jgi:D-alanine-D-alanine ligase
VYRTALAGEQAMKKTLLLAYETEASCRARIGALGLSPEATIAITSYLAQSTDLMLEFGAIADACNAFGIDFHPTELGGLATCLDRLDPAHTLVWTLTDGIAYYCGSAAPAMARLSGFATFGSDDALFALCQDKFRSGAVLAALGIVTPQCGLADGTKLLTPMPVSANGWFVKPSRLGSKIGIWDNSHCQSEVEALQLAARIRDEFRDMAVIQPYVPGRNIRMSFLDSGDQSVAGAVLVETGQDFQTMADSLALYGETGLAAKRDGRYREPDLIPLGAVAPAALPQAVAIRQRMQLALGLRDVWSMDFRLGNDGSLSLLEFEVCPGLPCFDFRAYLADSYGLTLPLAMAKAATIRLTGPSAL